MHYIIGLVGSGKTTIYRKLNEEQQKNSIEMEFPPSCLYNDEFKTEVFNLFRDNSDIDCIISHPFYLPKNFVDLICKEDKVEILSMPMDERIKRIKNRSDAINSNCKIFSDDYLCEEEKYLNELKHRLTEEGFTYTIRPQNYEGGKYDRK